MKNRRRSRELCLQVLFQDEFNLGLDYKQSLALFEEAFSSEQETYNYAAFLLHGIKKHIESIDWALSREE